MHLFTLFMEVILIRILEIGMHLFTLFLELKTNRIRILRIGIHLFTLFMEGSEY
jgi:hypothetical protein